MKNPEKEPKIEFEKKEEEIEKEAERVEVEKEPLPWEKLEMEEEARIIEEYEKKSELSEETKESINQILQQEADQKKINFAKEWFKKHQDEIKEKGYDVKTKEEGYVVKVTSELGGFNELKKEEKYRETNEEIGNLYVLKADLQKEKILIDSQFLMLNALNKRAEGLRKEREEAMEVEDWTTTELKEKELVKLSRIRRELSEKISGRDLDKEAEEKVEPLEEQEKYIDENLPKRLNQAKDYLQELDYRTEKKRIPMSKKIRIINEKGEIVSEFRKEKEVNEFLRKETEEKIKKELREEWGEKKSLRAARIGDLVEKEVQALGKSPEKAEGGIEEVYARVKKRLKTEFIERELKKEKKTKEQLKTIEKEFEKRGIKPSEFMEDVIYRKGSLENPKGNWEEDKDGIKEFFEGWKIPVTSEALEKYKEKMDKKGERYEKKINKEIGFMEWLFGLLFFLIFEALEPKEKKEKKEK